MTRNELTAVLLTATILFDVNEGHIFVRFSDAPKGTSKEAVMKALMKRVPYDVGDKGISFRR